MIALFVVVAFVSCSSKAGIGHAQLQSGPPPRTLQLRPVDDAANDSTVRVFRDNLLSSVRARNVQRGIESSVPFLQDSFKRSLALPKSAFAGPVYEHVNWDELERLLSLGGTFTTINGSQAGRLEFCAPYTYSAYPGHEQLNKIVEATAGYAEHSDSDPWVVLGENVPVRTEPADTGRVLGYLTYNLVLMQGDEAPGKQPARWRKVIMPDEREGWISADQVRAATDYHACFANIDGRWQMTEFARDRSPR